MNANAVLEALMNFFAEGNCKIVFDKNGCKIESNDELAEIKRQIAELQEKLKTP